MTDAANAKDPIDLPMKTVKLHGGIGDGQTVTLGWSRLWYSYARPTNQISRITGAQVYESDQYAPGTDGIWRVIDQYHPHFLR